jgi:G:T-mismatch repair DNA endonuclease (very short patch repair protein)
MQRVRHTPEELEEIKQRQEDELREGGKDSEYIVLSRSEDHSFFLRLSYVLDKYKVLIYLAGLFLVAMGFGFKTPKANYDELRAEIAIVRQQVQRDSIQKSEIQSALRVLIIFKCIETAATPRDMQLAGVDCYKYTQPRTDR